MPIDGRKKGKKYERTTAKILSAWSGIDLCRTPSSGALAGWPGDVLPRDRMAPFKFMVECKRQEKWELLPLLLCWPKVNPFIEWWDQVADTKQVKDGTHIPILIFKKNFWSDMIMIRLDDLHDIRASNVLLLGLGMSETIVAMKFQEFIDRYDYKTDF